MRVHQFHYDLPPDLIAQHPPQHRDASRLLHLRANSRDISHRRFIEFPELLSPDDLLVLNDTRVIPARLRGIKHPTGAKVEILLLKRIEDHDWWAMIRPGKRLRPGSTIQLLTPDQQPAPFTARVIEKNPEGHARLAFSGAMNLEEQLEHLGETPLPPYIEPAANNRELDRTRYQTVYAEHPGSVAAPTAGLHFTSELLGRIQNRGIGIARVTLHVGYGTFAPMKSGDIEAHRMHRERFEISSENARLIHAARRKGKRIVAVGTTTVRLLESLAALPGYDWEAYSGETDVFIYPPYDFKVVGALVTNFHLPESSLLLLVSAFASPGQTAGRDLILAAYQEAIRRRYRFYSYGDAMFIE